jgi:hypothetical protein
MQRNLQCYTCGTMSPAGQHYCLRCGAMLETRINYPTANGETPGNYFACFRCGAPNVVGTPVCEHCHEHFYYTCPHCNAWVNNMYGTCPRCARALNWPAQEQPTRVYNGGDTYVQSRYVRQSGQAQQKKSPLSTILLSVVGIGLLIIAFDFFVNGSSASSASNRPAVNAMPVSTTAVSTAPQTHSSAPSVHTPAPSVTLSPVPDTTPTPAASPSYSPVSSQNTYEFSLPAATQVNPPATGTPSPTSTDSYLKELDPGWGHCSGGSCRAACSQQ